MAEYIGREALRQFPIRADHYDTEHGNEHFIFGIEAVMEYAENLPVADVEPVIRCRDCTFWTKGKYKQGPDPEHMEYVGSCALSRFDKTESDFCSCGERKGAE